MTKLCQSKNGKKCWLEKNGKRITRKYDFPISGRVGCGKTFDESDELHYICLKSKKTWYIINRQDGTEIFFFQNPHAYKDFFQDNVRLEKVSDSLYYISAFNIRSYIVDKDCNILYKNVFIMDFNPTSDSHIIYLYRNGLTYQISIDNTGKEIPKTRKNYCIC